MKAFGTDVLLTDDGLTLLEMVNYGHNDFKVTHDFNIDESKLINAINNTDINDCTSSKVGTMLLHYYQMHKNAWVISKYRRATTFKPESNGIRAYRERKETKVNPVIEQYKSWNANRPMSVNQEEIGLNPETPKNLRIIIMRHSVKVACMEVEEKERSMKLTKIIARTLLGIYISIPIVIYWICS